MIRKQPVIRAGDYGYSKLLEFMRDYEKARGIKLSQSKAMRMIIDKTNFKRLWGELRKEIEVNKNYAFK